MISYVLVLRGINVGGKRRLLMADLKELLSGLQFENVQTYIQSGNVVFQSLIKLNITKTEDVITEMILNQFGLEVPVIILRLEKLKRIVKQNPFFESSRVEQLYCTFIKKTATELAINSFSGVSFEPDVFKVTPDVVYFKLSGKASESKMTNVFFEKKLESPCTTRNWKTTLKLMNLSK